MEKTQEQIIKEAAENLEKAIIWLNSLDSETRWHNTIGTKEVTNICDSMPNNWSGRIAMMMSIRELNEIISQ